MVMRFELLPHPEEPTQFVDFFGSLAPLLADLHRFVVVEHELLGEYAALFDCFGLVVEVLAQLFHICGVAVLEQ